MFSLLVSALVAMSYYGATAPTNNNALDLATYVTPPTDMTNTILEVASTSVYGHCNVGQLYCIRDIVSTLGTHLSPLYKSLSTKCTLMSRLGYPTDQILYQYCRDNPSDEESCSLCETSGCRCSPICATAIFECMDNNDWYKHRESCSLIRQRHNVSMSCKFGNCEWN